MPHTLLPPPPESDLLRRDRAALDAAVSTSAQYLDTVLETQVKTLWQRTLQPIANTLAKAKSAHQVHQTTWETSVQVNLRPERQVLWNALHAYRQGVQTDVIRPLHQILADNNVGKSIAEVLGKKPAAAQPRSPETVMMVQASSVFQWDGQEQFGWRFQKAVLLTRDWFETVNQQSANALRRVLGRPLKPKRRTEKTVPLRTLMAYQVNQRLPRAQGARHESFQQIIARDLAPLETVITAWMNAILSLECTLDLPEPTPPPEEDVPQEQAEPTHHQELTAITEQITTLEHALQEAVAQSKAWRQTLRAAGESHNAQMQVAFQEDLDRMGTFMLAPSERNRDVVAREQAEARLQQRGTRWATWHHQLTDRFALNQQVMALQDETYALGKHMVGAVGEAGVVPLKTALHDGAAQLKTIAKSVDESVAEGSKKLAHHLTTLQEETLPTFEEALFQPLRSIDLDATLGTVVEADLNQMLDTMRRRSTMFQVHPLPAANQAIVEPKENAIEVDLRTVLGGVFGAGATERLRGHAQTLATQLSGHREEAERLPEILHYNIAAALDELNNPAEGVEEPESEEPAQTPLSAAQELVSNGLLRSATGFTEVAERVGHAEIQYTNAVNTLFHQCHLDLLNRVAVADTMQEQMLNLRDQVMQEGRQFLRTAIDLLQTGFRQVRRYTRVGMVYIQRLIRLGQTAVGVTQVTETETLATLDLLAALPARIQALPLVYRRLFTFEPIADPSLLEGRDGEMTWFKQYYTRWQAGKPTAVMVSSDPGMGRTSFLQTAQESILEETTRHRIALPTRLHHATQFVDIMAEALALDLPEDAGFSELETAIWALPAHQHACFLENMEHLFLGIPGGVRLIQDVITFLSRTADHVFWVGTITTQGWQFLQKTQPTATTLMRHLSLTAIDRNAMETMILNRHHRSGLRLKFKEVKAPEIRRKSWFNRPRTPEEEQGRWRTLYFDRLYRLSGQSLPLALFYWLHTADFDTEPETLVVQPIAPLSFGFMQEFSLPHAFALKAFLQHGTLTVAELAKVFRMSQDQAFRIMEYFLDFQLIVATDGKATHAHPTTVEEAQRYRIPSLVALPILQWLQTRRIVH